MDLAVWAHEQEQRVPWVESSAEETRLEVDWVPVQELFERERLQRLLTDIKAAVAKFLTTGAEKALDYPSVFREIKGAVPELDSRVDPDPRYRESLLERLEQRLRSDPIAHQILALFENDSSAIGTVVRDQALQGLSVTVCGAGPSGLTLALILSEAGASVTVLDKRAESGVGTELGVASRRVIAPFLELEALFGNWLQGDLHEELVKRLEQEGFGHDQTGEWRGCVGAYQDVVLGLLKEKGVPVQFGVSIDRESLELMPDTDMVCIAAGLHSLENISLPDITAESFLVPQQRVFTRYSEQVASDRESGVETQAVGPGRDGIWYRSYRSVIEEGMRGAWIERALLSRNGAGEALRERVSYNDKVQDARGRVALVWEITNDPRRLPLLDAYNDLRGEFSVPLWMLTKAVSHAIDGRTTVFFGDATGPHAPFAENGLIYRTVGYTARLAAARHLVQRETHDPVATALIEALYEYDSLNLRLASFLEVYLVELLSYPASVR